MTRSNNKKKCIFEQNTVLDILAAISGVDKKTLWLKFNFIMTDATAHNMEVEALLAEELESTH